MKLHKTNRYRRPDKQEAYEVAIIWVYAMDDRLLDGMLCDENIATFTDAFSGLTERDAKQIIAKAVRVERGRQLNEVSIPEVIE